MEERGGAPAQHTPAAVDDLMGRARAWSDETGLTQQVERQPLLALAGAVALGYVLGGALSGGRGSSLAGAMLGGVGTPMGGGGRRMHTSDFARRHR